MIKIYTDGACSGNPGIGGWGVVILINDNDTVFLKGVDIQKTNIASALVGRRFNQRK